MAWKTKRAKRRSRRRRYAVAAVVATLTAFKLFAATPVLAEGLIDAIKAQNAVDPQKAFQFF